DRPCQRAHAFAFIRLDLSGGGHLGAGHLQSYLSSRTGRFNSAWRVDRDRLRGIPDACVYRDRLRTEAMHIHILGIGGTFMAGVALLARSAGHCVTGSDQGLYPPMSTQLADAGIEVMEGYEPGHLDPAPDQVVVGNAMTRGNPAVEYMLDAGLAYTSGPQWLA